MNLRPLLLLLACLLLLPVGALAEPADVPIDAAGRAHAIERTLSLLKKHFFAPERLAKAEAALQRRQEQGAYDGLSGTAAFAEALEKDLAPFVNDRHFGIRFTPMKQPAERPLPWELKETPAQRRERTEAMRRHYAPRNFGVQRVERLDGNVGYLRLTNFTDPTIGGDTAVSAMKLLAHTDALIVDLRGNGGGFDEAVALYLGWLLPRPEHVLDVVWVGRGTQRLRTPATPPAGRYGDKEVYVLTDKDTFSAAETFAYDLQVRKRARVVGETTAGGANSAVSLPAGEHLLVAVPMARTVHAVTRTSWEGTGVQPDLAVPAPEALRTAHVAALTSLAQRAKDPRQSAEVGAALEALGAPVAGARHEALRRALQEKLDALHAASRFPGATVGVALADGSTLSLAVGLADTVRRTPMRPGDRMLAGSVGKTFVAAVALQLVKEGKLSLDAPLSRYLGDAPWFGRLPNARDITVRMLMNHTSGIQRYEFKQAVTALLTREPDKVWTPEERVSFVLGDTPPFRAGAGWDYSDTNYILLGMVIERVTGGELYAEIRRRILEPHGLRDTLPSDRRELPGVVQGHAGPNNPFGGTDAMLVEGRMVVNPQMEWAGGGFASTATDLARWARLLYGGRVLDAAGTAAMLEGVPAKLGPEARYGLGVIIRPSPHGVTYGHSGFFPGWLTDMVYLPSLGAAIAIQVNTSAPGAMARPLSASLSELAEVVAAERPGT